jgi:hypothetical protein
MRIFLERLMAGISWKEVYAVLYPPNKRALRPKYYQPHCISGNRDTHISPASLRVSSAAVDSKSAGPDGVFAETLRWSAPLRRRMTASFLAWQSRIFNRYMTDGAVPDYPQFSDALMSVLF